MTIQAQVLDIIKNLQKELNTAMIMITHDLGIVAEVCDNVAVVYAGEIVEYGSKEEIFDHPTHPYTIGLFGSLPDIHSDVKRFPLSQECRRIQVICHLAVLFHQDVLMHLKNVRRQQ